MSRPRRFGEADRILWWKLYLLGEPIKAIAEKFETGHSTIRNELFGRKQASGPVRLVLAGK